VYPVEATQGYGLVVALIPGVALFSMFCMPFLFGALPVLRLSSLLLTALGIGWAATTSLYSELRPQPINFVWYQNQDSGQGYLTVRHRGRLPEQLNSKFSSTPKELVPFSDRESPRWRELAGKIDGGAGVSILEHTANSVALHIHTRKNIATVGLYTPASAGLIGYEIDGKRFDAKPSSTEYDLIQLTGLYGSQVSLKLFFETTTPTEAYFVNHFYPLPAELRAFQELRQPLGSSVHQGDQALSFRVLGLTKPL
jgi:hypothetical protein